MKFCVFDTEGSAAEGDYKGCSIVTNNESVMTYTRDEAIDILRERVADGYTLIAHNAEYDIMVLFWPAGQDVQIEYYSHKFSVARWYWSENAPAALIYDSLGLAGNLSIADIGKGIGLPKLDTPQKLLGVDPNKYEWKCEKHGEWECVECYCIRDAEIALGYLNAFEEYLSGYNVPIKRKIAGIAVNLWDRLDKHGRVTLPSGRSAAISRDAYHGGRCEAFRYGAVGPVYVYDVTSMYPYVMLTCPMPDVKSIVEFPEGPISHEYLRFEGASECTVDIPYSYVPVLPVRYQDKLCFPYGRVRGTFIHAELRAAVQRGCKIMGIHRTVYAKDVVYPFTNYVQTLNIQRDEFKRKNDPRQLVVKLLMNALYGRLGLRGEQDFDLIQPMPADKHMHDYAGYEAEVIGGRLTLRTTKHLNRPSPHSNVLWAATITAYARLKLLELMEASTGHLLYCDTDGVYTDADCIATSEGLGGVKLEGCYPHGTIIGPKLYRLDGGQNESMVRAKGVPRRFAETYLANGYVEYSQPGRVLEAFKSDVDPAVWRVIHKEHQLIPMKRQPLTPATLEGGGSTDSIPLFFGADDTFAWES